MVEKGGEGKQGKQPSSRSEQARRQRQEQKQREKEYMALGGREKPKRGKGHGKPKDRTPKKVKELQPGVNRAIGEDRVPPLRQSHEINAQRESF